MLAIYPWQKEAWHRVHEMQQQNRLPHALLFCGNKGIGLQQFAKTFAMSSLCLETDREGYACQHCHSCQLFSGDSHPDIHFIEPEGNGKQIKIARIRALIDYVSLKSFSGKNKIIIIESAEKMNFTTANALLKILEEPPEQSTLILLSYCPERMLITIRSRCQRINFKPTYSSETLDWLKQQNIESDIPIEYLLRLAHGGPLNIFEFLEKAKLQDRKTIVMDIQSLSAKKTDPIQIAAHWHSLEGEQVIDCLLHLLQDLIRLKLLKGKAKLINMDLKEDLQELVKTLNLLQLVRNYDFIMLKYQQLMMSTNYNPLNILEEIILNWNNPKKSDQG